MSGDILNFVQPPGPPDWLKTYVDLNFRLIFYETKKKGPEGLGATGWTERSDSIENYKVGQNVGTFTGHEISTGKFLVDVDFDLAETVPLSKGILPRTDFGFGRASRFVSHAFYTIPAPIPSIVFDDINGRPIVELRCCKSDLSIGLQTMLPPSIHPSGEEITLRQSDFIGHCDDLPRKVMLYAIAAILFNTLGHRGLAHETRLSVAGFLLSEQLTTEEVILIGAAIAKASGNSVEDVKTTVTSTYQRLKSGEHVFGKSSLIKSLGEDGKQICSRIKQWLGGSEFIEGKNGILKDSQENVKLALEKCDVTLSFDAFANKPMIECAGINGNAYRGALDDHIVNKIWFDIDTKFHFRPAKDFFYDCMNDVAHRNRFHPIVNYLKDLKWDETPRIENWLIISAKAEDSDYTRAVSSLMLIAAVRRITSPGCKFDEMPILESGTQGLLKSTALRTLCPDNAWFSDDLPLNCDAKSLIERTANKWLIEASDLSGMNASQVEHLKGMLSRQVDGPVRMAYGRLPVEAPRQFIVIGTTNSSNYLTDSTGNRRFWPIKVGQFDIEWIRTNRNQIWAEAFHLEQAGASIRLDPKLYDHAAAQQNSRRIEDPWEEKLSESFPTDVNYKLTLEEAWGPIGISVDRRDPKAKRRMLDSMIALGFTRKTMRREDIDAPFLGFERRILKGQQELPE